MASCILLAIVFISSNRNGTPNDFGACARLDRNFQAHNRGNKFTQSHWKLTNHTTNRQVATFPAYRFDFVNCRIIHANNGWLLRGNTQIQWALCSTPY